MQVAGVLKYAGGGVARISADSTKRLQNQAIIKGSKGTIVVSILKSYVSTICRGEIKFNFLQIDKFWCPTSIIDIDGSNQEWPLPEAKHAFNYPNSCGLRYEAEATRQCIRKGLTECETVSHKESLIIAKIQDEIRRQIGVRYPADDE